MLPQMQPSFCFTRKPMGRLDHRLLCSFAFGSQYSGQLRLILQDFVGKEWSSDGGALKLWHWYLVVVCQSCTEWLSQGRTEKLDLLLLRVAKMQFKRENGSVSLQISKMEMRYFSQNDKGFFSSQPTRQSSEVYWGIGGEGQLHQGLQLPSSSGFDSSPHLGSMKFMTISLWTQPMATAWLEWLPQRDTLHVTAAVIVCFASRADLHHAHLPSCFRCTNLSIPVWKVIDWGWIWGGNFVTDQGFPHL